MKISSSYCRRVLLPASVEYKIKSSRLSSTALFGPGPYTEAGTLDRMSRMILSPIPDVDPSTIGRLARTARNRTRRKRFWGPPRHLGTFARIWTGNSQRRENSQMEAERDTFHHSRIYARFVPAAGCIIRTSSFAQPVLRSFFAEDSFSPLLWVRHPPTPR